MTNMTKETYQFPLTIQLTLPENPYDLDFANLLSLLQSYGFTGVELNIINYEAIDPDKLKAYLEEFGLRMTMYASGALAKARSLSLSSEDSQVREKTIATCIEIIDFSSAMDCGIIFGFMKGPVLADNKKAKEYFLDSLSKIEKYAFEKKVCLLVEATNRYESPIANKVEETVNMIRDFNNPYLRVLPDTFHMNIEERNLLGVLAKHKDYFTNLHISDNNRYFPGLGAIDFASIFQFLSQINYEGYVAIEGNLLFNYEKDLKLCLEAIIPALSKEHF